MKATKAVLFICGGISFSFAQDVALSARLVLADEQIRVPFRFENKPIPKWQNGFVIAYDNETVPPHVFLFDRSGRIAVDAPISIPEAHQVMVMDVAVSSTGRIAVTGSVTAGVEGTFLVFVSPNGKTEKMVRTAPFALARMSFSSDGTLWAAARYIPTPGTSEPEPDHDVIRQYGLDGSFLRSMVARSSFPGQRHPIQLSFLCASADRVGFYSPASSEWLEIATSSGQVTGRWKVVDNPTRVKGAAMTAAGGVYLSTQTQPRAASFLKLDRAAGRFVSLDISGVVPTAERAFAAVLGADGNQLGLATTLPDIVWASVQ